MDFGKRKAGLSPAFLLNPEGNPSAGKRGHPIIPLSREK
jgi:hypothetical protein